MLIIQYNLGLVTTVVALLIEYYITLSLSKRMLSYRL